MATASELTTCPKCGEETLAVCYDTHGSYDEECWACGHFRRTIEGILSAEEIADLREEHAEDIEENND